MERSLDRAIDRRVRCQRSVLVVFDARHADGMVHSTTGREWVPTRICTAARTDGCGMVDMGIQTHGTLHTSSDQRSREENRQSSGGWVVQSNEHGLSIPRMLLPWTPVHPTRGEGCQRETHDPTARRDPKEHRLHTSLCQGGRAMGCEWKDMRSKPAVIKSVWMLPFLGDNTRGGRWRHNRSWPAYAPEPCSVWSSATFAYRKHSIRTLPRCSPCSRTSVWRATISVRSCADAPKNTTSWRPRVACSWGVIEAIKSCSPRRSCDGTRITDSRWYASTRSLSTIQCGVHKRPSSSTPWSCWGTRATGRPSPTWTDIVTWNTASFMINDRRSRQCVRDRDEQENHHVRPTRTRGILRSNVRPTRTRGILRSTVRPTRTRGILRSTVRPTRTRGILRSTVRPTRTRGIPRSTVRQDAHVAVLLRLYQQEPGPSSVPVLRDGHSLRQFGLGRRVRQRPRDPGTTRTSGAASNGSLPNVAAIIRTSTCRVDSPVACVPAPSRAARRTIRRHRVCSRWNGPVTGSWGCAARHTIVSEPPTSTALKDWANVTTISTRTRSWTCSPTVGAEITAGSGWEPRPCWRTCRNERLSPTSTPNAWFSRTGWARGRCRKVDALWPRNYENITMITMDASCIVAGSTGCDKSTFVTCMLRHAAMIYPEKITWCYGE